MVIIERLTLCNDSSSAFLSAFFCRFDFFDDFFRYENTWRQKKKINKKLENGIRWMNPSWKSDCLANENGFEIKSLSIRYKIGRRYMMWSNIIFSISIDILLE